MSKTSIQKWEKSLLTYKKNCVQIMSLSKSIRYVGSINKTAMYESASKAVPSTKPKKKVISEGKEMANRFKKLAGLIK